MVEIDDAADLALVRQLLRAHEYLSLKNLPVDLVIVNEVGHLLPAGPAGGDRIPRACEPAAPAAGRPARWRQCVRAARGGHVAGIAPGAAGSGARRAGQPPRHARRAARPARGSFRRESAAARPRGRCARGRTPALPQPALELFNGTGGFAADGQRVRRSFSSRARPLRCPGSTSSRSRGFGFQVSATGSGFTWSVNSRENALTPWSNDAVGDPPPEAIYVRDDDTRGDLWRRPPRPMRDPEGTYVAHHGQGYSRFEYSSRRLASSCCSSCRAAARSRSRGSRSAMRGPRRVA